MNDPGGAAEWLRAGQVEAGSAVGVPPVAADGCAAPVCSQKPPGWPTRLAGVLALSRPCPRAATLARLATALGELTSSVLSSWPSSSERVPA